MLNNPDQNETSNNTVATNEQKKQLKTSLQEILNKPTFQHAVTAHRMFDMHRHSGKLWSKYPDFQPPLEIRSQIETAAEQTSYNLDEDQVQQLATMMYEGGDYIKNAWLFAAAKLPLQLGGTFITAGHSIRDVLPKEEQKLIKYKQMRGMFIRLGKEFDGTYIMQLDGGGSRELYDADLNKKDLIKEITDALYDPNRARGSWISSNYKPSKLVVCNENYKIDDVYDIEPSINSSVDSVKP